MNCMMRIWHLITIILACNAACQAQTHQQDSLFLNYLLNKSQYADLILEAKRLRQAHGDLAESQLQTTYYQGVGNYFLRQLDSAAGYFGQVKIQSPFYWKSRFYQSFSQAYQRQTNSAIQVLGSLSPSDSLLVGLKTFNVLRYICLKVTKRLSNSAANNSTGSFTLLLNKNKTF